MEEKTAVATEVNRLYWETEQSVAEISNQLGVSRRALYEVIEPMPSGMQCSRCRAELYYSNRSAKAAGVARCLICGNEKELDADVSHEDVGTIPPYGAGWPKAPRRARVTADRTAAIAGFAIAGVVAGTIATLLIRRKR
ncbi:MAG TPA: hypothetical protein VF021_07695 [Longimicrobiales bacterium]